MADEVRGLAQRAAEAARNTGDLISSTVSKIQDGTAIVRSTEDAFNAVSDSSDRATELVTEIDESSQQQGTGIEHISVAHTEMDKTTQQNAEEARGLTQTMAIFKTADGDSTPQKADGWKTYSMLPERTKPSKKERRIAIEQN
mgnify:CR=1 FL=1